MEFGPPACEMAGEATQAGRLRARLSSPVDAEGSNSQEHDDGLDRIRAKAKPEDRFLAWTRSIIEILDQSVRSRNHAPKAPPPPSRNLLLLLGLLILHRKFSLTACAQKHGLESPYV